MDEAAALGMTFLVHVADPDTWFATRYRDATIYGTKRSHYEPLERLLDEYRVPWIAAHMGGSPEDLPFIASLLERHPNLHLDTSATKWMVRELSRHPRAEIIRFLERWRGRILFGSDIVTSDDHLHAGAKATEMAAKARDAESAFDLYASRYWALRVLWERDVEIESPISDPDLAMVDPRRSVDDAPVLSGKALPPDLLRTLYHDAAVALLTHPQAAAR
jgi:predicted TIM-barrel fold metal-dependent hydrolase